jgi:outer membrane protein TolC
MNFGQVRKICSTMKSFNVLLILILTALSAVAQTNANTIVVPAETNAPAAPSATNGVAIQTDTNAIVAQVETNTSATLPGTNTVAVPTNAMTTTVPAGLNTAMHEMSLEDCFQEALQHNLDLQIERTVPQISLYNLRSSYGGYDPVLSLSGQHNYSKQGALIQDSVIVLPTTSDENSFGAGFSGGTPWGMTYNFGDGSQNKPGSIGETWGQKSLGTNTANFDSSSGSVGLNLTQPLLKNFWIDSTRLNIRLAKNQFKSDEQGLRLQLNKSVTDVENAYYELIYAQENVKVQQEALALAQTQLDQDRQRVQIGTLAQLDVQQDEAQVATSRANLITAQYTLATAQNTLKNLLTDTYTRWHDTDIQPTGTITNAPLQLFDLQDSWSKGMNQRPDLLQARLAMERQGIQLKFDRNQLFPELDLFGSYGFNGAGREYSDVFSQINEGNRPFYSYGGQLIMPLSNLGPRNTYKASKLTLQQMLLKLKQYEQNVMVEIDNAVKNAQSTYESVGATRQARFYAEAALDAEQKKYAVGKSTTFTVLQLQNTLTADRGQEIRALANYYEALANLALQEGSTLERNHINIEVK